jgi:hypothetical protein
MVLVQLIGSLYLTADALAVLKERREHQVQERRVAKSWDSSDYIFSTTVSTLTFTNNVRRVYRSVFTCLTFVDFFLNCLCLQAGYWHLFKPQLSIPYIRIHD